MGVPVRPMARAPVPLAPPRWLVVGGSAPLPAGAGAGAGAGGIRVLAIHAAVGWAHAAQVVCVVLRAWVTIGVVYHGRGSLSSCGWNVCSSRVGYAWLGSRVHGSARSEGLCMGCFQKVEFAYGSDSRQIHLSKPCRGTHGRPPATDRAGIHTTARPRAHPSTPSPSLHVYRYS